MAELKKIIKKPMPAPAKAPAPAKTKPDRVQLVGGEDTSLMGGDGEMVSISIGKTINIGNYEVLRVDYGVRHRVKQGQTFEEATAEATSVAVEGLKDMVEMVSNTFKS